MEVPKNRVWWCPAGPFAFLPIHAAGIYNNEEEMECISDYCISSYSSTLQDLLVPPAPVQPFFKLLAVIQPELHGDPKLSLPGTVEELQKIENHLPQPHDRYLTKLGPGDTTASVKGVLSQLPSTSFAHFGCHALQNDFQPLESALLLEDGNLKMSDIFGCHMPNALLAYLSACETARGDWENPDEAMHITATMIFAGFRGAVGTLW